MSLPAPAGDKWRLMGDLSVSRSLGDLPYIARGLSSDPEVSTWVETAGGADGSHPEFLVLASDGLFEALSADEVCRAAHSLATGATLRLRTTARCDSRGSSCGV